MIILNGKKIKYAISGIFVMLFILAVALGNKNESSNYIDTVSLPVSGKTVVIDARTWKAR